MILFPGINFTDFEVSIHQFEMNFSGRPYITLGESDRSGNKDGHPW
jgi:hypothetical protein